MKQWFSAILILMITCSIASAQHPNGWKLFTGLDFKEVWFAEYGASVPTPIFEGPIKQWEGKEIILKGYVIPINELNQFEEIVLSKYPYESCFFCGQAGVETVAEVILSGPKPRFKNDKLYTFKGRLKLNDSDLDHLNFLLVNARVVD